MQTAVVLARIHRATFVRFSRRNTSLMTTHYAPWDVGGTFASTAAGHLSSAMPPHPASVLAIAIAVVSPAHCSYCRHHDPSRRWKPNALEHVKVVCRPRHSGWLAGVSNPHPSIQPPAGLLTCSNVPVDGRA